MTQTVLPPPKFPAFQRFLQELLPPQQLLPSLTAGTVTGIIGVIRAISYATLIFSGSLATHLPLGVGLTVISSAIGSGVVALTSAHPGMIATPLAAPTALLAIMASGIATELAGESSASILATVIAAIALTSLVTGGFLLALGWFKMGSKIRIIPYPVVGGFMAGTGWLLVRGFVQMSTDLPLDFEHLPTLFNSEIAIRWAPGLVFGLILLGVARRWKHYLVLPGTLLLLTGVFYLCLGLTHTSLDTARSAGWLLEAFPEGDGQLWHPLQVQQFPQIHWRAIVHQSDNLITVMLVSLLSLALSNSGIELVVGRDINLNAELKAIGLANLVAGFGSGMVSNQALPSTLLVHNIGAETRLTGLVAMVPCITVLLLGSSFLPYLPEPVLASLLLYLGFSLLIQWIIEARHKIPLADYGAVLVTLVVINSWGFLQGIAVGFVVTVITFMYNYSHVDVAKSVLSGFTTRSNVISRSPIQGEILTRFGDEVFGLELQGFLFFGTAHYLLHRVRQRIASQEIAGQVIPGPVIPGQASAGGGAGGGVRGTISLEAGATSNAEGKAHATDAVLTLGDISDCNVQLPLRYIIFDFRQVTGLDSSAVLTFNKILKLARKQNLRLIFTNIQPEFQARLVQGEGFEENSDRCLVFPDIDRGLEWCENQILSQTQTLSSETKRLHERLSEMFLKPDQVSVFMEYLKPETLPAGVTLLRRDEPGKGLYFLETGQVTVLLDFEDGKTRRLQTCQGGSILGEMRFFGKRPLSTAVVTDLPCRLYYLPAASLAQMKVDHPHLVYALEEYIVRLLCDSLTRREEQLRVMR
ncbi:MAG: SulP family inorganic anion transporter [Prochlorothrix sp.]|nr:SulP family inorganic anion transporter [Prochlorothrix sp.]